MNNHTEYMNEAVKAALKGMNNDEGGPFGCIVVKMEKLLVGETIK